MSVKLPESNCCYLPTLPSFHYSVSLSPLQLTHDTPASLHTNTAYGHKVAHTRYIPVTAGRLYLGHQEDGISQKTRLESKRRPLSLSASVRVSYLTRITSMGKWAQGGYERACADKMKTFLLVPPPTPEVGSADHLPIQLQNERPSRL